MQQATMCFSEINFCILAISLVLGASPEISDEGGYFEGVGATLSAVGDNWRFCNFFYKNSLILGLF